MLGQVQSNIYGEYKFFIQAEDIRGNIHMMPTELTIKVWDCGAETIILAGPDLDQPVTFNLEPKASSAEELRIP